MSTALAVVPQPEPHDTFTRQQLDLIKHTLAAGLSDNEFALYIEVAKRTGLDPLSRQIYAIKRGDKMTIQTGIDGYRAIASRTGSLAGIDDAVYDTEDADHPARASVTVWRFMQGSRVPFTATARWTEYKPGPPNDRMWGKMPYLMLGKCAEALALRKAFPVEIAGVYTADEMAQADNDAPGSAPEPVRQLPAQHFTLADCGAFAKDHDIPPAMFKAATKKYSGRPDDLMRAMMGYVREQQEAQVSDEPEIAFTVEEAGAEERADLASADVGKRGN